MTDKPKHIPGHITYLVCVDETDECRVAMRLAALRARYTGGQIVLLYVIKPAVFQHWAAVGEKMAEESRMEAEERLQVLAAEVHEYAGIMPVLFVKEGSAAEQILQLIEDEPYISAMVLGCAPEGKGHNDLVHELTSQLTKRLSIPLLIVPGNLSDQELRDLT
jgi:nucleotide-binding universal stress UspA family protein